MKSINHDNVTTTKNRTHIQKNALLKEVLMIFSCSTLRTREGKILG